MVIMNTAVLNLKDRTLYWKYIEAAAQALRMGELVAFPTETVYGLGARRDDTKAIEQLYEVKNRPEEKRLTLMIADPDDVKKIRRTSLRYCKEAYVSLLAGRTGNCFPFKKRFRYEHSTP